MDFGVMSRNSIKASTGLDSKVAELNVLHNQVIIKYYFDNPVNTLSIPIWTGLYSQLGVKYLYLILCLSFCLVKLNVRSLHVL